MSQTTAADTSMGHHFLEALAVRDFERLATLFHPDIQFRAITPPAIREGTTAGEAAGWISRWMGDATEFDLIGSSVDFMVDRLHLSYRIRLQESGEWFLVEQHAYCTLDSNQITALDLVCSGFRPIDAPG